MKHKFINIALIIIFSILIGCTNRVVTKEQTVEIREVEIKNDSVGINFKTDFTNPDSAYMDYLVPEKVDSEKIEIVIPKKIDYKPKTKTIKVDERTSVDVTVTARMDSGKIDLRIETPKIAYQESTITNRVETDTSKRYTTWIIIITILAFIAIIIIAFKKL